MLETIREDRGSQVKDVTLIIVGSYIFQSILKLPRYLKRTQLPGLFFRAQVSKLYL